MCYAYINLLFVKNVAVSLRKNTSREQITRDAFTNRIEVVVCWNKSKKEDKDQESIQSSTTKSQRQNSTSQTRAKRSALSRHLTTRHQQTDVHESITKQDRNNINDPKKKHRLGSVSKSILLEDLNRFNGAPTSPLVQMWIKSEIVSFF